MLCAIMEVILANKAGKAEYIIVDSDAKGYCYRRIKPGYYIQE